MNKEQAHSVAALLTLILSAALGYVLGSCLYRGILLAIGDPPNDDLAIVMGIIAAFMLASRTAKAIKQLEKEEKRPNENDVK